jgi:hypothetical protein
MAPRRPRRNANRHSSAQSQLDAHPENQQSTTSTSQRFPLSEEQLFVRRQAMRRESDRRTGLAIRDVLSRQPEPRAGYQIRWQEIRMQSRILLDQLDILQGERMRIAPVIHPAVESSMVSLRVKLDTIYWRIFRVNHLPPEILANIFRFVAWSSSSKTDLGVKHRLWITWVCRHWRSVAIADFTLWNAIWFRDFPPYDQAFTWFERAGTAPLDLRIAERDESWASPDGNSAVKITAEEMEYLFDRLLTKLSQIRILVAVVDTWPPALVILHKLQEAGYAGRRLGIERFELHRAGNPYVWIGPGYEPDFHRAPIKLFGHATARSLSWVTLNGIHIDWSTLPISNLTTLDLRRMALDVSPSLHRFRDILRSCPNLHKLALDGAGPSWQPSDVVAFDPIPLLRLRILVLGDFSLQYALYVLAQIYPPYVRDLTLLNMNGEDYTPLLVVMTSYFKDIRVLTLYTFEVDDSPSNRRIYVKWLESMPSLGYLRFAQIKPNMLEGFSAVVESSDGSTSSGTRSNPISLYRRPLCPRLNVIEYQNMAANTIVLFGLQRSALGVPLRKIYINAPWVPSISENEQAVLRQVADLFITEAAADTPEETALMKD